MKRLFHLLLVAGALEGALALPAAAQSAQFDQRPMLYSENYGRGMNYRSARGLPLSNTNGTPTGSDGRLSPGSVSTPGQFRGMVVYGAVVRPASTNLNVSSNYAQNAGAENLDLPRATNTTGTTLIVLRAAQVGAPYLSRPVSFLFGSVIRPPEYDETGALIPANTQYWAPEPFSTTGHADAGYYWSPHAQAVFATQPGPVSVVWRKLQPATTPFEGALTNGGLYYRLTNASYVVSGSAVKQPRKMHWTEGTFRDSGKPVSVPAARVSAVKVAYSAVFPERVEAEYEGVGQSLIITTATNRLQELRTLWYDHQQGQIFAYNREGRVLVELLGDTVSGETRRHLGFEIVDVSQVPYASDITTELGERLPAYADARADEHLTATPLLSAVNQSFVYQHNINGSSRVEYYAAAETANLNDVLLYWLESGIEGLQWPLIYARYKLQWPGDVSRYSHYIRPLVPTEQEAALTAVPLPTDNVPIIQYQDPLDSPRGKLTADFKFYTYLEPSQPAHRALLRFSSADRVGFERVYSWLDTVVKSNLFDLPVVNQLKAVEDYKAAVAAYPILNSAYSAYTNYAAYTNALANYAAYTNALANYVTYTNALASYVGYTNALANYVSYTNALANYMAYTNYLGARSRGVNGTWNLYVRDDVSAGVGSVSSWVLHVITTNVATGSLGTNYFTNSSAITIPSIGNAAPYPSSLSVSGITNDVLAVKIGLNGVTHSYVEDIDVLIVSPLGKISYVVSDAGASVVTAVNWLFEDNAPGALPPAFATLSSGTYKPTNYDITESLPPSGVGPILTNFAGLLGPVIPVLSQVPEPTLVSLPSLVSQPTVVAQPTPVTEPSAVMRPNDPLVTSLPVVPVSPVDQVYGVQGGSPRVVSQTVNVGDRISGPVGEPIAQGSYLSGYILQTNGTTFNPVAYKDPFVHGFDVANVGAIIPVNAIPGRNNLDVWWFRRSATNAVRNQNNGFKPVYWPSVIGRYTLVWPESPDEIVLASNLGSGPLDSFQAKGTIYTQNDPALPGYNPNEEHAVMLGGQAYALRDDLNITSGLGYSSQPFVLLDFSAADGRPAMRAFRVLREKPFAGVVFDYVVTAGGNRSRSGAGSPLQAPMPLPLLSAPIEFVTNNTMITAVNYNAESAANSGDLPAGWSAADASGVFSHYARFTHRDRKNNFWVMRGMHVGLPDLEAGTCNPNTRIFTTNLPVATAVLGQPFTNFFHASRQDDALVLSVVAGTLPSGLSLNGMTLAGVPAAVGTNTLTFTVTDTGDGAVVTNTLLLRVVSTGTAIAQGPLSLFSTNLYAGNAVATLVGRPPFLATSPMNTNSFTMRFYYKTQSGFAWPGVGSPPAVGSIVPYLRPLGSTADPASKSTPALDIVYRPVWPSDPPTMRFGQTLTDPKDGLPAVRGQSSAKLLYQQSIARVDSSRDTRPTVILHDPTREKEHAFTTNAVGGLTKLPDGVRTESYQGKIYFPNLPPHLAQRFFFDPNRGTTGKLVYRGEFKDEVLGAKYLLLNVLTGSDLATVKALCPSTDLDKQKWDLAIDGLKTTVETFHENPQVPGQYVVNTARDVSVEVGALAEVSDSNTAVDSYALSAAGPGQGYVTLIVGDGGAFTPAGEPVTLYVLRVKGQLHPGELKVLPSANPLNELISFQHTLDMAGKFSEYDYEWKINPPVDGVPPPTDVTMSGYQPLTNGTSLPRVTLGGAGIQALVDNYLVMRYRPANTNHPLYNQWSEWTSPQLAEGWIKRVLAGINPFNQRVIDLYNNTVNTDANILTSAGRRWEGDIALNLANINNYGLIEIYETVLRRGKGLSIEAGINFGPANDALLLAAGYLNDLYMLVGNEAYADAANPTIGIGTKDNTYGDIATALFAFKGQAASLLEEELALLRGRDDVLQPGVTIAPIYNRLVWNYTRGIDAGEVIYALNYNILDQNTDGKVDAADAAKLFPQGHGDAYGHYLTAAKGYYSLLMNQNFDWVPRTEAVTVLGQPVQVDYLDERKFATAAAAVARTGRQVFDLTWRKDYVPSGDRGWGRFATNRVSSRIMVNGLTTNNIVREWGADQWASRTGQGAFLGWLVGNAILPDVDPNPEHEGIQKIDRTTVPELLELAATAEELQTALDNAEGRLTPLGLSEGSLAFDINPNQVVGGDPQTHFEQVYSRAKGALNNAVTAFDDAKGVTRLMRSEQDSLQDLQTSVARQELAYTNALIELYGTPYSDDVGPGKTYKQGYEGPDLFHYAYVETPELIFGSLLNPTESVTFRLNVQGFPSGFVGGNTSGNDGFDFLNLGENGTNYIEYTLASHGYFEKPKAWTGRRRSPGEVQQVISDVIKARAALLQTLDNAQRAKDSLDGMVRTFKAGEAARDNVTGFKRSLAIAEQVTVNAERANELFQTVQTSIKEDIKESFNLTQEALPKSLIAGLAAGGDLTSAGRSAITAAGLVITKTIDKFAIVRASIVAALRAATDAAAVGVEFNNVRPAERTQEQIVALNELASALRDLQGEAHNINQALQAYDDAQRAVRSVVARGERLQVEREIARQRAAAVVQGFRTRDAAFRIFRNEKLERYKTLFDLAARFSFLAANAYDYETGLLHTEQGKFFVNRIVSARALGVMKAGEPQYAGSNTGDPGLSSALAEMKGDWDVLKGRLGFNNPDAYGTTVSLRSENFRILPGADGNQTWQDVLQQGRVDNLLDDVDVRRHCLQIDPGTGLPVPGIVLTFSTTITPGQNLFGRALAAGDSTFNRSTFATKLFAAGVALEGYRGMNNPVANGSAVSYAGGISPADPSSSYLDPKALAATPYVYLIPVGVDAMRSPPLGDASAIRTWTVNDVTIPLPFNLGASDFSTRQLYQSADSLTEPLFGIRKHAAFRPVSTTTAFSADIYGGGSLQPSQFTNRRLIGRTVWNSKWKLVIPGDALLSDSKEGLDRFIQTVTDVKLHLVTYGYSGN